LSGFREFRSLGSGFRQLDSGFRDSDWRFRGFRGFREFRFLGKPMPKYIKLVYIQYIHIISTRIQHIPQSWQSGSFT